MDMAKCQLNESYIPCDGITFEPTDSTSLVDIAGMAKILV